MAKKRLLYVAPTTRDPPGGLEGYTLDLYEAIREPDEFEPSSSRAPGSPFTEPTRYHGWSPFAIVEDDPNQYLFYTNTFADLSALRPAVRQVGPTRRS